MDRVGRRPAAGRVRAPGGVPLRLRPRAQLGILFQYYVIQPMRHLPVREGLKRAAKADFLALSAFEIGLFGWMAIMQLVLFPAPHHLPTSTAAFWFLMQICI